VGTLRAVNVVDEEVVEAGEQFIMGHGAAETSIELYEVSSEGILTLLGETESDKDGRFVILSAPLEQVGGHTLVLTSGGKDFEEQLIFPENLTEKYFLKHGLERVLKSTGLEQIKKHQKEIFKDKCLTKYYALLKFDGDSMGKLMSGDLFINEKEDLKNFQKEVSKLLSTFALEAKNYLDNSNYGKTIYAGGDDFLAFINLNYLFEVLKYLRQKFNNDINLKTRDKISKDFTFSAGITIAHYKIPLHFVLDWTDKSEKRAKNIDGKDAFTITVLKHSGEIIQSTLKWNNGDNAQILGDIIKKIESKEFSSNFIQVFNKEFSMLCDEKDGKTTLNDNLLKIEFIRLLKRSAKKEWSKEKKKIESQELAETIFTLYNKDEKKLKDLISILEICDFVVRKTK